MITLCCLYPRLGIVTLVVRVISLRAITYRLMSEIWLQLLGGNAEVFGTELAKNKVYSIIPRSKLAIFTWYGCTLRISSPLEL